MKISLLILLCLLETVVCWVFPMKNKHNLMTKYTEHCGSNSLCSDVDTAYALSAENVSMNCPMCSCEDDCEVTSQCCPDKSLSTCIQPVHSVNEQNFVKGDRFMMVSICPQRKRLSRKSCLTTMDKNNFQHLAPVSSLKTNITYVNAHCSKCHEESEIIEWISSISCPNTKIDLNIYSNIDDVSADMKENNCTIEYFPPPGSYPVPCETVSLIRECNFTGEWDVYDEDVETACKNHWNQYGIFQNIFCFQCNTNINQRQIFKSQSTISTKISQEQELLESCKSDILHKSGDNSFIPRATITDDRVVYNFTEGTISEEYQFISNEYKANLALVAWDVGENVKCIRTTEKFMNYTELSEDLVNMTALYEDYVRSGGYQDWCHGEYQVNKIYPGIKSRRACSCDRDCYKYASCCPDVAYYQQKTCFSPYLSQDDNLKSTDAIYVISKCPLNYTNSFVKSKCEQWGEYEIFNVPVFDVTTNEAYRNHYCYLCHNQDDILNNYTPNVKAFNVTVVCPKIMYPMFMPSMDYVLKSSKLNKCSLYFTTSYNLETCPFVEFETIQKCNVTGVVKSVSKDARRMCDDPTMNIMAKSQNHIYKNQICDLCNSIVYEDPIGVCMISSKNSTEKSKNSLLCKFGQLETEFYPYKNDHCRRCNKREVHTNFVRQDLEFLLPSYRQLFSTLNVAINKPQFTAAKCKDSEFYDTYQNTCRQLYCSPGKFLQDSSCTHFIPLVESVNYKMAFKVLISSEEHTVLSTLEQLDAFIQHEIQEGYIEFNEHYIYANKPCSLLNTVQPNETSDGEAIVYLQMSIIAMPLVPINRTSLEAHLMNFPQIAITLNGVSLEFQDNVEAWYLPFLHRRHSSDLQSCLIKSSSSATEHEYVFDVNKLLTCTQIQLEADEFVFTDSHARIYITTIGKQFDIDEFAISGNGTVRICSDSYKRIPKSTPTSLMESVLTTVTYTCTLLSLLSLILSFITYCTLPILRTVAGKNIMCFCFSLFVAQLLFLVRSRISFSLMSVCAWVGGLTHYFWVLVFSCTNVCSFHMFKLFVGNCLVHGNKTEEKFFLKYCFVTILLPILPVLPNIIFKFTGLNSTEFGYGGSRCFLISPLAILLTFIFPVIFQIIFNLFMFSITFHHIRKTPKVQSSQNRDEFSIFLKLFWLTGISWLFMVIDGFFEISPFTFLATVVNGSQGVFLFISYVCNKKVLGMLKKKYTGKPGNTLTSTKDAFILRKSEQECTPQSVTKRQDEKGITHTYACST